MLIRTDSDGGTHDYVAWLHRRRLSFSVGFTLPFDAPEHYRQIPKLFWEPAYDQDRQPREGRMSSGFTGLLDMSGWPPGTRVIVRRRRPHAGAQLRFDDVEGYRLTAFRTRAVGRSRISSYGIGAGRVARTASASPKTAACATCPCTDSRRTSSGATSVALAIDLHAWMGLIAHPDTQARRWEPKRLRFRLFTIPATIARTVRTVTLHLSDRAPWADDAIAAIQQLRALPGPNDFPIAP